MANRKSRPEKRRFKAVKPRLSDKTRLNKYIAASGLCSRRKADELISAGRVSVNGVVSRELGISVSDTDEVVIDGKSLSAEPMIYVLLHKPRNVITTLSDEKGRETVMDLFDPKLPSRAVPVGRLDRNTTGTLLLTNDGQLANRLLHPSHQIEKVYSLVLNKSISEEDLEKLSSGVLLEDGEAKAYFTEILDNDPKRIRLGVHEGRNRLIRRMFETLGYEVERLKRTKFATLDTRGLNVGKWRYLTEKEVNNLRRAVGMRPVTLRKYR